MDLTQNNKENGDNVGPQITMKSQTSMDGLDAANQRVAMLLTV